METVFSNMVNEAAGFSETSALFRQMTRRHSSKGDNVQDDRRDNLICDASHARFSVNNSVKRFWKATVMQRRILMKMLIGLIFS